MSRGKEGSIHGSLRMISSKKMMDLEKHSRKQKERSQSWTWKQQAAMVKWTKDPIQASLLKFESPKLNQSALHCFIAVMQYMGDYPLEKGKRPTDCLLSILMNCHNARPMRDEVYCQVVKQVTNNRSTRSDGEQQGWRLLSVLTSYFDCGELLRPYLLKYLEQTAYDTNRQYHAMANICLQNLRTTFRYGGRKNVPSKVELEALTSGRTSKRQMCVLPGGTPVILNVRSSSVVIDIIDQICRSLGINETMEREEFVVFYVIEKENKYCPLAADEYIFDITTELVNQKKEFYLLFQRTSWVYDIHTDANRMYVDVMYHQCIPDYLDGYLLAVPDRTLPAHLVDEISMLAALQMRAMDKSTTPQQKDAAFVVPRNVQSLGELKLSVWTNKIYDKLFGIFELAPHEAKLRFLQAVSRWPLFGSTFFNVKSVTDAHVPGECLLAINKQGVYCLNPKTHETLVHYSLDNVVSARRFKSEQGVGYMDLKYGDLMLQKVVRLETDQGADISTLVGQYVKIMKALAARPS